MEMDLIERVGITEDELIELCEKVRLENEVEKYRVKMQALLDALRDIEEILTSVAEEAQIKNVEYEDIEIKKVAWRFGSGRVYEYRLFVRGKLIPPEIDKIDTSTYVYGDFNNYVEYADVQDILYLAENIETFIQEFKEKLEERNETIDELLKKFNF